MSAIKHCYLYLSSVEIIGMIKVGIHIHLCVKQLEKVIGENAAEVDWQRSFFLNLIAHTSYSVTVAICR